MHIIINFLIKCRFTEFEERKEIGRSDVFSLLITFLQSPVDQFRTFFLNSLLKCPVFPEIKKFLPLNPGLLCFGCNGERVSSPRSEERRVGRECGSWRSWAQVKEGADG